MAYARAAQVDAPIPKRQRLDETISFFDIDVEGIQTSHDDTVAISMTIANYNIKRI